MKFNFKLIIFFICVVTNSYCSIIFQKDNIVITDYDIKNFDDFYYSKNIEIQLNENQKIKQIILINQVIDKLTKTNPKYLNFIDETIQKSYNQQEKDNTLNLLRFDLIKIDLIKDYYFNKITLDEIKFAFKSIKNLKIPLSKDNCNFIHQVKQISEINNFDLIYFNNIKNPSSQLTIMDNDIQYQICFNNNNITTIENTLTKLIEKEIYIYLRNYLNEE